jgi:hypothetical protein
MSTTRHNEIAAKIVEYIKTKGRCPNFSSIETDYDEGNPIFEALLADGTLVEETRISPKGRKMTVVRLANACDCVTCEACKR